jgi:hypothetical protein
MPSISSDSNSESDNTGTNNQLTPELVRQVTDKVYQLFLRDLKLENERRRGQKSPYRR